MNDKDRKMMKVFTLIYGTLGLLLSFMSYVDIRLIGFTVCVWSLFLGGCVALERQNLERQKKGGS